MPNPEPGRVFYSREAGKFYQEGRRGALPTLEAFEHLTQSRVGRGLGFRDELGRAVPSLDSLLPKYLNVRLFNADRTANVTARDVYKQRAPASSYYQTLFTWVDDAGKLHIESRAFRGRTAINRELEDRKIQAAIGKKEGTPREDWYKERSLSKVRLRFHYVVS